MRKRCLTGWWVLAAIGAGCGAQSSLNFPNRLVGAEGRMIVLDDIVNVVEDNDLTDEEKRQQLRELGIEDEKLIEALLASQ